MALSSLKNNHAPIQLKFNQFVDSFDSTALFKIETACELRNTMVELFSQGFKHGFVHRDNDYIKQDSKWTMRVCVDLIAQLKAHVPQGHAFIWNSPRSNLTCSLKYRHGVFETMTSLLDSKKTKKTSWTRRFAPRPRRIFIIGFVHEYTGCH